MLSVCENIMSDSNDDSFYLCSYRNTWAILYFYIVIFLLMLSFLRQCSAAMNAHSSLRMVLAFLWVSCRYNFTWHSCSERLVAKKAVKSGSGRSYVSFLVKDLLKLRTTLGNTSFFHSAPKTAPKKLLALKSFLTNLGNAAIFWGLQVRTTEPWTSVGLQHYYHYHWRASSSPVLL